MSYLFEIDDRTVWSPANQVAELYLGTMETVSRVLERHTGLTDQGSGDWFAIERDEFQVLVTEMVRAYAASGHWEFRLLLGSVLAVSIGILDRAGIEIETRTDEERKAVTRLRETFL